MKVHFIIPYSNEKNLGRAYNEAMRLVPDGDYACFLDYDVMMLTPDTPKIIHEYVKRYPDALLTCYTNRIHPSSQQLYCGTVNESPDMRWHLKQAEKMKENLYKATPITKNLSGLLMVISKDMWNRYQFAETGKCLGVDTDYWKRLLKAGERILRMDGVYVWHTYRLLNGITDKQHLA